MVQGLNDRFKCNTYRTHGSMFEDFFDQIERGLGPLNPGWFEELTAKASRDGAGPDISKAEEEEEMDTVKAPETSALGSQLFSTPKIFKQRHLQSPDSISNEDSPYQATNGVSSACPWTDSSPCMFGSAKDRFDRSCGQPGDYFGLLDTPKASLARSAKQISESLGAQINPDLSWSSSFNTPSSLTPTVILPKTEDRAPSASCLKDKEAIFVRKLFPTLSKGSESNVILCERASAVKHYVRSTSSTVQADGLGGKPICSPDASPDMNGLWKQTVPTAIEDGDIRSTVQKVLDGAENVLSIFFSNSTSALRRVKTKERNRRRINDSSKDVKSTVPTSEPHKEPGEILNRDKTYTDDLEAESCLKNKHVMQWSPLSLLDSSLNEGVSSGLPFMCNHNTVASNETDGGTFLDQHILKDCTSQNSPTFSKSVERVKSFPNTHAEGSQCQKFGKSPAFTLARKPSRFVYQVLRSELSKTVTTINNKHTLSGNPPEEEKSSGLNESSFISEDTVNHQIQQQVTAVQQVSTDSRELDQGLDMTQLSKAFAEDFTQEITTGEPPDMHVQSDISSTFITICQGQSEIELDQKNKDGINQQDSRDNHNDCCALADVSVSSPNKSTVALTTFEISHDSGCPTTFSGFDGMTASCTGTKDNFSGFKTANNKVITVPQEAIMRAKASLDKAVGDGLINTLNERSPKHNHTKETIFKSISNSTNTARSTLGKSILPEHASRTCNSDELSSPGLLSSKSFKQNISSCSSPQSKECDYKIDSERNITVSDFGLQKARTLLKEKLERDTDSSKWIHKKLEFQNVAEKQTVLDINGKDKPTPVDSSHDDVENCPLTASQKADVTELCNLLEDAESQYEFTQFKAKKLGSDNHHTSEREWDPDLLKGIDFDDSFNSDVVKGKQQVNTDASSISNSVHTNNEPECAPNQSLDGDKLCTISKEKQDEMVHLLTAKNNLGKELKNAWEELSTFSEKTNGFGFKTAKGNSIVISEKSLNKARHFFEEDDIEANRQDIKADTEVPKPEQSRMHSEIEPLASTSGSMDKENKRHLRFKQDEYFSCGDVNADFRDFEMNNQVTGNCLDRKTDVVRVNSNSHFGFSTAKGEKLKVSEKALLQARTLFNNVDSLEEPESQELNFHTSGKHDDSISASSLQKTKAVSWSETSIDKKQFDSPEIPSVPDVPSHNSKEQKSGDDAKGVLTNSCPSKLYMPKSVHGHGFQTASGKGVSISAQALKKTKAVFKDCGENIDCLKSAKTGESNAKMDIENVKKTNGFTTASGKSVKFSAEAIKNAKAVFKDIDLIIDFSSQANGDKVNERNSNGMKTCQDNLINGYEKPSLEQKTPQEEECEQKVKVCNEGFQSELSYLLPLTGNCGFSTASGKKVSVSAETLQRAKDFLSESVDGFPNNNGSRKTKEIVGIQTDTSSSGKHFGFSTAGGKKVSISATALQRAKHLFKDCEEDHLASEDLQNQICKDFSTPIGKKYIVSEKALNDVRAAFAGFNNDNFSHEPKTHSNLQSGQHKSTSRKPDLVREKVPPKTESSSRKHIGFSTAGGKTVAITATALRRAKSVFKNCEEESLVSENFQHQNCKGFSTASGKYVTVSEKALNGPAFAGCDEPKIFSDLQSGQHEISCGRSGPVSEKVPSKTLSSLAEHKGFWTAGGTKEYVSASALQRAKSLFKDCEDESFEERLSKKVPSETVRSCARIENIGDENLKCYQLNTENYGFITASGKGVSVSKVALEEASKLFKDCDIQQITGTDNQPHQTNSSKCHPSAASQNVPAQLDLHSLDFSSCTVTQQKYFEQEAMACTKALLADDDLNEPAGLVTSEDTYCKKSSSVHDLWTQGSVDHNRRRKRQLDADSIKGQPPLKRQLLSEFDQTSDAKSLGLTPLKSCPNGTIGDRRIFKYNVHLQPNVTCPNWNSIDQKSNDLNNIGQSVPKGGVFVTPFRKTMKTETSKGRDVSEKSTDFIPPFKKANKDNTGRSNSLLIHSCVSKPPFGQNTALDKRFITSTSNTHNVPLYCGEKSLHVGSKPETTVSVENIPLKNLHSEERDTEAWQETLRLARDMQDMRLQKKKRQTIRPLPGSLYLAKTSGDSRKGLKDAVGHKCPGQYTLEELYQHGVHYEVSQITSENAESYRFDCNQFFNHEVLMECGAAQLADGGWLVPDCKCTVGKEEFFRALCDTPGVDPKLITDAWVFNHYRWIIWKRASMERAFPDVMGGLCLTPEQVLLQLKFRYDVEVDQSRRSALRRIIERDDTPAKTLVLCVCGIAYTNQEKSEDRSTDAKVESTVVWLTDGWYAIRGLLDPPLSAMLHKGCLRIGDKVMINGAELVGSQEACPPLEAPESLMLKISANSTRRARWNTKLGYCRDPRPFRLPLSSMYAAGGVVSCVDILVLRSYPTQWMEKKPNGIFIFRNDRAEDREARKHSNSKHKTMELLISNMQAQIEKEMEGKRKSQGRRRTFNRHEIEALHDGEELYEAMEYDPAVETHLSERQMEAVSKYRQSLGEKRQAELQERVRKAMTEAQETEEGCTDRDVTPVWKLSITDASDLQSNSVYTLNIWRPSVDLYSLLREGRRYRAYHLSTSDGKKRSGIAHIQLTATKKTLFQDMEVSPEWLSLHFHPRECVNFRELQNPLFSSPCGEVDIVGCIVSIVDRQGSSPVLYLVDEKFDIVSVRTSINLEQLAVEELVKPRALVALSNLQLRPFSGLVPSLYAGEQALFSINPKESHLQEAIARLKTFVFTCEQFFSMAEEKVSDLVPSGDLGPFLSPRAPGVQSTLKINSRVNVTPQQKGSVFTAFTPVNKRPPVSASNSEGKDPQSLKRKRGLVYLSRIPSPPPLTPLKTKASPCINKTFNPPRRCVTPKPPQQERESPRVSHPPPREEEWVPDEELVMIDTQVLLKGLR
ncbi:breast cancer type 2 susceptibility protein isoform X2 [Myxocyprinus asiaticus]|uniref:breast cancer type 2 susceptibility protein isoform X2 n=1 Tax=Myxocyprinus asiaticus TaxID=70543 RepID=UPI002222E7F5|nr:breast cancer type 2 susceptibility protein isoform X2 [Myxocyprinus asiaticus]